MIIAVDGPSGSGKSSTARGTAERLGYGYLDTGAMYRAATWAVLDRGFDPADTAAVAAAVEALTLAIGTRPGDRTVTVDGTDVTAAIREPRISARVSAVATNLDVRAVLRRRQRELIDAAETEYGGVVVEGRDIATVVAPDAELKVLVTADPEARMQRRKAELSASATTVSDAELADQVMRRDADDATVSQFEVASDGAVEIDTTHLSLEQVIDAVCELVRQQGDRRVGHSTGPAARSASFGER